MKIQVKDPLSLESALIARDRGEFPQWLDTFLRGSGNNVELANGLQKAIRWWVGPIELSLNKIVLKCGPGLEFHEDEEVWNSRIAELSCAIRGGLKVPPLVAEYKDGKLLLADGNHRHGALEMLGQSKYWTAIWFNSLSEYEQFKDQ